MLGLYMASRYNISPYHVPITILGIASGVAPVRCSMHSVPTSVCNTTFFITNIEPFFACSSELFILPHHLSKLLIDSCCHV